MRLNEWRARCIGANGRAFGVSVHCIHRNAFMNAMHRKRSQTPDRLPLQRVLHSVISKAGGRPSESLPVKTKSKSSTKSRLQQIKCPKTGLFYSWGKCPSESWPPGLSINHLYFGRCTGSASVFSEIIWFVARISSSMKTHESTDLTFAIVCSRIGPNADPFSETKPLDSRHSKHST